VRKVLMAMSLAAFVMVVAPVAAWAQGTVRVFVTMEGAESGFSAGKGAQDSVLDLTRALNGKKRLTIVNSPSEADIVVEVESRDSHWDTGGVYKFKTHSGRDSYYTTSRKERVVYATLKVDDYTHQFHGQGSTWTAASGAVAGQIDKWVDQNLVRLIEMREARK
jgi:hypothetical protein